MADANTRDQTRHADAPYFMVGLVKLTVLSVFSFGLYDLYWFYQQWKRERARTGEDLWPVPRALFAPILSYALFRRVRRYASDQGLAIPRGAGPLALSYFLLTGLFRLPDPYWLVCIFSFLPLLPVQAAINKVTDQVAPGAPRNDAYSLSNVVLIVIGAGLLLLTLVATFWTTTPTAPAINVAA